MERSRGMERTACEYTIDAVRRGAERRQDSYPCFSFLFFFPLVVVIVIVIVIVDNILDVVKNALHIRRRGRALEDAKDRVFLSGRERKRGHADRKDRLLVDDGSDDDGDDKKGDDAPRE